MEFRPFVQNFKNDPAARLLSFVETTPQKTTKNHKAMKSTKHPKTIAALGLTLALAAGTLSAAPTEKLDGGRTRVALSTTFVDAVTSLNVSVNTIRPGRERRGQVTFPVESGAIDLDNLAGEIVHSGGLRLSAGETVAELIDFVIDTTGQTIVLSGLVIVNDSVVGRVPLFTVTLTQDAEQNRRSLTLPGADLTLTAEAAAALNSVFGVTAFTAGLPIGTAIVNAQLD